jgi:hypothetical protein
LGRPVAADDCDAHSRDFPGVDKRLKPSNKVDNPFVSGFGFDCVKVRHALAYA